MRSDSHNESLAQHFLEGGLTEGEEREWRERLEKDPDLLRALAEEVIRQQGRVLLKRDLVGMRRELYANKKSAYGQRVKWMGSLATILLIGSITYWAFFTSGPPPVASYYEPYRSIGILRNGVHDTTAGHWEQAMRIYEQKDYPKALSLFELAGETEPVPQPQLDFYKGMCYLFQPEPNIDRARDCLQAVDTTVNNWNHQADWYLAYVYFQEGQMDLSKEMYLRMVTDEDHRWEREAQEILDEHF